VIDHSADDRFHAKVLHDTQVGLMVGHTEEPPETTRWRITYLCNHCNHMHAVSGTFMQVQQTMACFMILGYPILRVEDEGFAQLVALDGHDINTQEGLEQAAEAYQAFCDATRS
jgi:hypothetical protein